MKSVPLLLVLLFFALQMKAQQDGILHADTLLKSESADTAGYRNELSDKNALSDNSETPSVDFVNPKKTALFSAILPGLGQVYNKQYWKLPIIYGAAGVAAYFINDNYQDYQRFRKVYYGRQSGDPLAWAELADYDQETVRRAMDISRRYLDLSVLLTALGYTLQIIDAAVFAHLKNFDLSPDISLNFQPVASPTGGIGMGLVMRF